MNLKERIDKDLKEALKERDEIWVSTLRLLKAAIKNAEIEVRGELDDGGVVGTVSREVKRRREAIESYKKGGREELARREERELGILEKYLPEQLSFDKIKEVIRKAVERVGAGGLKDFGKVMGVVMGEVKGRADGAKVKELVKEMLDESKVSAKGQPRLG